MDIAISGILKKLRKERGNTQEELAVHVGVSDQAVSKWERGESFPDITLLPAIAFYYDVTTDDLLGVSDFNKQAKIQAYWKRYGEAMRSELSGENLVAFTEHLWREAYAEFPNDIKVILRLMLALFQAGQFEKHQEHTTHKADELIKLGEQVLRGRVEDEERYRAIEYICYAYIYVKNDMEKAKEYIKMLPFDPLPTVHDLMPLVLEGDEALAYRQDNLLYSINQMYIQIINMLAYYKDNRDRIHLLSFLADVYRRFFDDGDYDTETYFYEVLSLLAHAYAKEGAKDEAVDCITSYADASAVFDRRTDWSHTSLMANKLNTVNRTHPQDNENNTLILKNSKHSKMQFARQFLESLRQPHFDFIRSDERFIAAEYKLKQYS